MRATVPAALAGERLDRAVAFLGDLSRAHAGTLVDSGAVLVNGVPATVRSRRLRPDDEVEFPDADPEVDRIEPDASVEVPVVFADEAIVVVDKPAGLVVHPGAGHLDGTLAQGLLARYPELLSVGDPLRPGIVHRLDQGTSGLLVVARTPAAYDVLVRQMAAREVRRVYDTLVWGHVDGESGVVDAPIGRSPRDPTRMAVVTGGRPARTAYDVVDRFEAPGDLTRLRCRLETGRTHQIRVHLAAIGHPVVGDVRYGGDRQPLEVGRPFLHATQLAFSHPVSSAWVEFDSPLPPDLAGVLASLGL